MNPAERPLTLLIAALGGEGGGVLADWIHVAAGAEGYPVQGTSIPGVAQRTGATTSYLESYPVAAASLGGRRPVMTLAPAPGYVDVMIASELLEAARAMQNGFVTPDRTTLIASSHRAFAVIEKSKPGTGAHAVGSNRSDTIWVALAWWCCRGHRASYDVRARHCPRRLGWRRSPGDAGPQPAQE